MKAAKEGTYRGDPRADPTRSVTFDGRALSMRLSEVNHSPSGMSWGYLGSGAAQLAYAVLRHHFGDSRRAEAAYQRFKFEVVANLPQGRA